MRVRLNVDLLSGQISPPDPPDSEWRTEFLRALGRLLVQSGELEYSLVYVYRLVTGKRWEEVEDDVRDVTLGVLVKRVLDAYEKRFPDGEMREAVERLKPTLREAVDTRNAFVHAKWVFVPAEKQMERERLPRGQAGVRELQNISAADVERATDIVEAAAERVMEELCDRPEMAALSAGSGELRQR